MNSKLHYQEVLELESLLATASKAPNSNMAEATEFPEPLCIVSKDSSDPRYYYYYRLFL